MLVAKIAFSPRIVVEAGEEVLLELELLGHRLDHEVAVGKCLIVGRAGYPPESGIRVGLLELPPLDGPGDAALDPLVPIGHGLVRSLEKNDIEPRLSHDLADPRPHSPAPNNPNLADSHDETPW